MTSSSPPSTHWRENVAPDEAKRYAHQAQVFADIQTRKSRRYGTGRTLHRKQITAAQGALEVLGGLPPFAQHGLFARAGEFNVQVRLSNGGMDRAPDRTPDIRGFAMRVPGVHGDSALGNGPATSQDFLLINQETFGFVGSDEFTGFVEAASRGSVAVLKYMVQRHGLGAPGRLLKMAGNLGKRFGGFATEPMFSAVPMACGPYAVRVRLLPAAGNGGPASDARNDWAADFSTRLARQTLQWDLQLQPFVSEAVTPIEDASVNWPTPFTTVARLVLPQQPTDSPAAKALAVETEAQMFDPWHALAEHRPLGDVQRARKVVYFKSQKGRGAV